MNATSLSVFALWTAALLYAIAMVAFSLRMATLADLAVMAKRSAVADSAEADSAAAPARTTAAAAAGHGTGRASTVVRTATRVLAPQRAARERAAARNLGIGRAATLVGALMHAIGVVARGIDAGHVPWSTMYEMTISGALAGVVAFLVVQARRNVTYLAPGVTGFAAVSLGVALLVMYRSTTGLQPALQSYWLVIHVLVAVSAMGVLSVAAVASVLQLMQHEREDGAAWTARPRWRWLSEVPGTQVLEGVAFRLNAVGFVAWTFTLIAGAIWAEHSWGRYWGWDPKETWTLVIWLLYAAYLHARTTQGWSGRKAAWLSLAGFLAVMLNFTLVNLVFQGLHTYAKGS